MFAKNKRGFRVTPKNNRVWSLCCVHKEKIVKKRLIAKKKVASIQIQKVATFNSRRKIINLIPNKSLFRIKLIFHNISYFLWSDIVTFENIYSCFKDFQDGIFILTRNVRKSSASEILFKKKILWNINFIRMRRKIIDDCCL